MRIYLAHHGKAKSREEDPSRPLTPEGVEETTDMIALLSKIDLSISHILHSGKARAQETADILVQGIQHTPIIEAIEGLAPSDDPQPLADRLSKSSDDVMIVGHLPHLQRLVSLLLTEETEHHPVTFQNSGVVCIERNNDFSWSLRWAITPQLAGQSLVSPDV
ncbi:MAG: phosphohistidine phosphatase SixA [Acidobacteriota bacterium]